MQGLLTAILISSPLPTHEVINASQTFDLPLPAPSATSTATTSPAVISELVDHPVEDRSGEDWTREEIVAEIRAAFPEDSEMALAIARCESNLKPTAHNTSNQNGSEDASIFQINSIHHPRMAELGLDPWDVEDNVKFARVLYEESGWQPWVCYTNGMVGY